MRTIERTPVRRGLRRRRSSGLRVGADDALLVAWTRHYAAVVALFVVGCVLAALTWGALTLPKNEVWSIVVDKDQVLPARQLGVVAEALFRAESTYRIALPEVGMTEPSQLYKTVQLIAVPESRILIIEAKGNDRYQAERAADAMARALAQAFDEAGYPDFTVLGSPQPAPIQSTISTPTLAMLGAMLGLLLGLCAVILIYRAKRPVVALQRTAEFVRPETVIAAPGRRRWLGALRTHPPGLTPAGAAVIAGGVTDLPDGVRLLTPGIDERRREPFVRELGLSERDEGRALVVCDPKTREDDLLETMLGLAEDDPPPILLWLE
ncbi:MAG: hypothetical protein ACM3OO_08840 [Planctomycetaceae bacterium]